MISELGEVDEEIEELFLEEAEITEDVLNGAIRRSVIANKFSPVFMGSAVKNKGIQPVLDAVSKFLPSPNEIANVALDASNNEAEV